MQATSSSLGVPWRTLSASLNAAPTGVGKGKAMRLRCRFGALALAIMGLVTPSGAAVWRVHTGEIRASPVWAVESMASPPVTTGQLFGVSCVTSKACESVGFYLTGSGERPLAEVWNGTTWALQGVPVPSGATVAYAVRDGPYKLSPARRIPVTPISTVSRAAQPPHAWQWVAT